MKRLLRRIDPTGNLGLSLIELIVSMAILAVVGIAVGGAMYVSSRSYRSGSAEINVQEEAQVASNLICDWLVDATKVEQVSATELKITHPEGGREVLVRVYFDSATGELKYTATDGAGTLGSDVLASNVSGVNFNSTFDTDRNVKFSIDFNINDRTYHSVTDSTSRNHDFISTGGSSTPAAPIIGFEGIVQDPATNKYYLIMEPGQNADPSTDPDARFTFKAKVYNYDSNTTLTMSVVPSTFYGWTCTQIGSSAYWEVTCSTQNRQADVPVLRFTATKTTAEGTLTDSKDVQVLLRRATKCDFVSGGAYDAAASGTHEKGMAGAVYTTATLDLGFPNVAGYPAVEDQVYGAAFDRGTYAYRDPSHVQFYYMLDKGAGVYEDGSAYVTATEQNTKNRTNGTMPNVQVTLAADLPYDLWVVAVADHSGSIGYDGCLSPYGLVNIHSNNRINAIKGYADFGYTQASETGRAGTAYVGAFKIEKGTTPSTPPPFNFAELGISRNTPSFEMGHTNDAYLTWLKNYLVNTKGYDWNDVKSGFKYMTVLRYREQGSGTSWNTIDPYILYKTDNWDNLTNHQNTQSFSDSGSHHEGYFFELDKAYDIQVTFLVYDKNGNFIWDQAEVGSIPAATPRIYDPTDAYGRFTPGAYDGSTGHTYNHTIVDGSGNTAKDFYIYFDSVNMNGNRFVNFTFQEYIGPTGTGHPSAADKANPANWKDVTSSFSGCYQTYMCENATQAGGLTQVKIPAVTGNASQPFKAYTIKGYDENAYPDYGVNVERIQIYEKAPFESGKDYRISFDTTYRYVDTANISTGTDIFDESTGKYASHIDYNSITLGSSSSISTDITYHLSDTTNNTGYIYVHGN